MNRRQRRHFERFHEVSIYDPRRVLQAYGGDFDRVMANNDAQVALRVAAWERQQGFFVRNCLAPKHSRARTTSSGDRAGRLH